ncbi:MAG: hypothetical protein LBK69_01435 [Syntrophomonadaceae bacterium]|jgi:hypothetical protein|nr:hypothetical protein [Syntrophomonadaceae bacterium]
MAGAKNKVIAGDYKGGSIKISATGASIYVDSWETAMLNKHEVETYELITDEHTKSAASGIIRGVVGDALLGPVGLLAGALSAKNKGIYQVAIQFRDGKRSLLEIDDKSYKALVKDCF